MNHQCSDVLVESGNVQNVLLPPAMLSDILQLQSTLLDGCRLEVLLVQKSKVSVAGNVLDCVYCCIGYWE